MASIVDRLQGAGLVSPPSFLRSNVHYEVLMGSVAYGVAGETSDWDVYGFCIPPKDMIFPHLRGEIPGFGNQIKRFEQYQQHHIAEESSGRSYDIAIYSIIKYFQLCMENNPNMIDSLFVPQRCVLHSTMLGNHVRENRRMFLHRGCWHKFKGYAFSQLHKMATKTPQAGSKRASVVEEHRFDVKFAYHVVRLMREVEQILTEGDLDLERDSERLKAIRRGDVSEEEIRRYFSIKEKDLERAYAESKLPYAPNEEALKRLLLECLEMHYGSLAGAYLAPDRPVQLLREIQSLLDQNRDLLR